MVIICVDFCKVVVGQSKMVDLIILIIIHYNSMIFISLFFYFVCLNAFHIITCPIRDIYLIFITQVFLFCLDHTVKIVDYYIVFIANWTG